MSCLEDLQKGLRVHLSDDEIEIVTQAIERKVNKAQDSASDLFPELEKAKEGIISDLEAKKAQDKYQLLKKISLRNDILKDVVKHQNRAEPLFETLLAKTDGSMDRTRFGGRASYNNLKHTLTAKALSDIYTQLEKDGLLEIMHSKDYEDDVAKSIATGEHDDERFKTIGAVYNNVRAQLVKELMAEGIPLHELDGRLARQTHVGYKLLHTSDSILERTSLMDRTLEEKRNIAFNRWFNFHKEELDFKRTFPDLVGDDEKIKNTMRDIWNERTQESTVANGADIESSINKKRVLHFKSYMGELKNINIFGQGSLSAALEGDIKRLAGAVANARMFGLNRDALLKDVGEIIKKNFKNIADKEKKGVDGAVNQAIRLANQVDGKYDASDTSFAMIGGNIRTFLSLTQLGNVALSSLGDTGNLALEGRRLYGGWLGSISKSLFDMARIRDPEEKKIASQVLLSMAQAESGGAARWAYAGDAGPGLMTNLQRKFFKINMLHYWDKNNRITIATGLARHLALNAHKSFEDIVKDDKKFGDLNVQRLQQYGISGDEWDLIRKGVMKMDDGNEYLLSEGLDNLKKDEIKSLLKKEGRKRVTDKDVERKRDDLKTKLNMYYEDRTDHVILRPDATVKNFLFRGTEANSGLGQAFRMIGQYKQYPATYIRRVVGDLVYGNGADTLRQAFSRGDTHADFAGLGGLIAYNVLMGYAILSAKSVLENKTPPPPDSWDTIKKSILAGGAFAIAGDYLLGTNPNFKNEILARFLGPFASTSVSILDAFALKPMSGKFSTSQALRIAKGLIPGHNLPLVSGVLNYFIFHAIQNKLNPEYSARQYRRLIQNGQNYIINPM